MPLTALTEPASAGSPKINWLWLSGRAEHVLMPMCVHGGGAFGNRDHGVQVCEGWS